MNNQPVYRKNQIQTLILLLKVLELKSHEDNFFELVLFLARYSFLFENPQDSVNSCTSEIPQIYTEQAFSDWSMKFTDPDGCDIKGVFRGLGGMGLSALAITGGVAMMAGAGAAEVPSAGTSTLLGIAGFGVFVDGLAAFALSAADFSVELADCFKADVPNGDLLPSNIGECVGSGIDMQNGFDAQVEGEKGPMQKKLGNINTIVSAGLSTVGYASSVKAAASQGLENMSKKDIADVLVNEASHQMDVVNATRSACDLNKDR